MAITIALVVLTLVVTISDGMMGHPNFGFGELPEIRYRHALPVPQPPALPGFPQIYLPQPPPLPYITFKNPYENDKKSFQHEPYKPFIPVYQFPTMETIKNIVYDPNSSSQGLIISTSSNSNGQGVSDILFKQNGKTFHKTIYYPGNRGTC